MVVGDVTTGTEVLVIGGGPGGYVAARRAGQKGLDTTLVEMEHYGGTCLNVGCIPSKAIIAATDVAHEAAGADRRGVHADPAVDLAGMVGWKDRLVRRLTKGVEALCEEAGVELIEGRVEFAGDSRVRVVQDDDGQGAASIQFEHAIVATGSRPVELPAVPFDGERVLSSREALALETVPDRLVVVGGGYIGMELATAFQKLGADVVILEQLEDVLPGYEADMTEVVRERATDLGISFHFEHTVEACAVEEDAVTVSATDAAGDTESFTADRCLVAVGRTPVTDTLNLEAIGLETDENGFLPIDEQARTAVENVFAAGDVAGEPMLAHKAFREGEVAASVIAGEPAALDYQAMPAAVFTDPEIATVGMTETEALESGFDPVVGQMPLRASGRALTLDEREGFVRVVADDESGFILGAQLVGPEVSELVGELSLAIELGATLEDVAGTVHVHPTLSEALHEAVMGARGESLHY